MKIYRMVRVEGDVVVRYGKYNSTISAVNKQIENECDDFTRFMGWKCKDYELHPWDYVDTGEGWLTCKFIKEVLKTNGLKFKLGYITIDVD